jgi:hypothetical protein
MSSLEILNHCGAFCEVLTRHGTLFGVLLRFSATAFMIRTIGLDSKTNMIEARDIIRVTELPEPRR